MHSCFIYLEENLLVNSENVLSGVFHLVSLLARTAQVLSYSAHSCASFQRSSNSKCKHQSEADGLVNAVM